MSKSPFKFPTPQRGEVYFINCDPVVGSEQGGRRPVVVVSPDSLNSILSNRTVQIVTITSQGSSSPLCIPIQSDKGITGFALIIQNRAVDKSRLLSFRGRIADIELQNILKTLQKYYEY